LNGGDMEGLYKIPAESCSDLELRTFWASIVAAQSTSGMSIAKFCHMHGLRFLTFKDYKYRRLNPEAALNDGNRVKSIQKDKDMPKFIPLQIATAVSFNKYPKNEAVDAEIAEIKIVFKNNHKLIIPATITGAHLLSIIKMVAELQC
jgi:hypothetical protein